MIMIVTWSFDGWACMFFYKNENFDYNLDQAGLRFNLNSIFDKVLPPFLCSFQLTLRRSSSNNQKLYLLALAVLQEASNSS